MLKHEHVAKIFVHKDDSDHDVKLFQWVEILVARKLASSNVSCCLLMHWKVCVSTKKYHKYIFRDSVCRSFVSKIGSPAVSEQKLPANVYS